MADLSVERPLKLGEVRSIRSDNGKTLEELELLFSSSTIAKFEVNHETNKVDFLIDNTDLKYQDLQCSLDKDTIKNIVVNLRELYSQLDDTSN